MNVPPVRYVTTEDGIALAYWTLGEGGGRPLVMVPSGVNRIEFEASEPRMRAWYDRIAQTRQIVCYDARGVGASDRPADAAGYDFAHQVRDVSTLVDELGFHEFDLWGSWHGAQVALEYAAAAEERVRHLVLWNYLSGELWQTTPIRALAAIREIGDLELWAKSMALRAFPEDEIVAAKIWERLLRSQIRDTEELSSYMLGIAQNHGAERASAVACPALLLQPERSGNNEQMREQSATQLRNVASRMRNARTVRLHDALIVAALNPPEPIAELIEELLDDGVVRSDPAPLGDAVGLASGAADDAGLSAREIEVLYLIVTGRGNRQIAEQLVIAESTVANHVRSILAKTGTANRGEAGVWAVRHELGGDAPSGETT